MDDFGGKPAVKSPPPQAKATPPQTHERPPQTHERAQPDNNNIIGFGSDHSYYMFPITA